MPATKESEEEKKALPASIPLITEQWISLNALKAEADFYQQKLKELEGEIEKCKAVIEAGANLRLEVLASVAKGNGLEPELMNQYVHSGKELIKA